MPAIVDEVWVVDKLTDRTAEVASVPVRAACSGGRYGGAYKTGFAAASGDIMSPCTATTYPPSDPAFIYVL